MQCYFAKERESQDILIFDEEQKHHLKNVLRLQIKSQIIAVFDRVKYLSKIISFEPNLKVKILEELPHDNELAKQVVLLMPILKKDANDLIVQKATELGVFEIIGFTSFHSVVKFKNENDIKKKILRWQAIANKASSQSYRNIIPQVTAIINFKAIKNLQSDLKLVANELATNPDNLNDLITTQFKKIIIIVGPEGGFSKQELLALKEQNFKDIFLGKRVLRSETAAISMLANISYLCDNLKETR